MNLSREVFAEVMDMAVGKTLNPPFDLYANSLNYLLASYTIPTVGLTTYVGAGPPILGSAAKLLLCKVLAVEAAQDAIIRDELYRRRDEVVPYDITAAPFTGYLANLRNSLANQVLNEGIVVAKGLGAEGMTTGNVVGLDGDSISYAASPEQYFGFLYLTGSAAKPGGFFPNAANGIRAQNLIHP